MTDRAIARQQRTFDAVPTSARAARQFVSDLLRQHDATAAAVEDCTLVVSELVSNIIEHGDGSGFVILLDVTDPAWWEIEVTGGAADVPQLLLEPDTWTVARADDISGRGLGIVRRLMDHVVTNRADGQFSVCCRQKRTAES
jgi:anti-sigma regulatory factor (Ser/Thr protein kinase)